MRTLQLYPAKKRVLADVVRKLQFVADGSELVAWVDEDNQIVGGSHFHTKSMFVCAVASGVSRRVEWDEFVANCEGPASPPVLSPDGRFLITEVEFESENVSLLLVQDRHSPTESFPEIGTTPFGFGPLFFTPDGSALIAVRNGLGYEDDIRDIARFEMAQLTAPPKRFHEQLNPFTGERQRVPVRNLKWKTLIAPPPWGRANIAALSANGRFLAVGDVTGAFHIADLKAKRVTETFPPEGKTNRDRVAVRIAFDPKAEWIVRLAGGKLFARPLKEGKPWQTKSALGSANDFAFHPSGGTLCAVFSDGHARYLDASTGAVRQSFKWAKRPKPLHSVCFAPDGLTCAAGGENGQVVIWDVDP